MPTIHRLYLYAVCFISLETALWNAISLARALTAGGERDIDRLAGAIALLLVSIPVFLLHWYLAQRSAARDPDELSDRLRALFLYGILLATLIPAFQSVLALVNQAWLAAFSLPTSEAFFKTESGIAGHLIAILLNAGAAAYFYSVLRSGWRAGLAGNAFTEVERLFRYLWLVYTLALAVLGIQQFAQFILGIWETIGAAQTSNLANGLALLLVGGSLWAFTDLRIRESLQDTDENRSLLRWAVLYTLIFFSVAGLLISVRSVLGIVIRSALGQAISIGEYLSQINYPVSVALALGAVLAYSVRSLSTQAPAVEAAVSPTAERSGVGPAEGALRDPRVGLRRFYLYLLSLLGLAAVFWGLHGLGTAVVNLIFSQAAAFEAEASQELPASLATLAVGLPLWLLTWAPQARAAAAEGEAGDYARRSMVRRGYLFLVLFAGVLGLMYSAGALLFALISALLGEPAGRLTLEGWQWVITVLLFALFLFYHWLALRSDNRLAERSLSRRRAQFPVLILSDEDEPFAQRLAGELERTAPGLPVAVHSYRLGVPDESLSAARAVVIPAELVAKPTEAIRLWLQGYAGLRLVVPTPARNWYWVFGSGHPLSEQVRRTARIVRRLAEGEELLERKA